MISATTTKQRPEGRKLSDLLVLAPGNDPFYAGRQPKMRQAAEWLAKLYHGRLNAPKPCHLRRLHYALVSMPDVYKPTGAPYQNTENDWQFLLTAAKHARYMGLIPYANIRDHRTQPPTICFNPGDDDITESIALCLSPEELADQQILGMYNFVDVGRRLPYHLEILAEKTTMHDILSPIARDFHANLVEGAGELSISSMADLVERVRDSGKPARLFYISDFDPAGRSMPVAAARKIQFLTDGEGLDIRLRQLVLTGPQCRALELPRTPIKDTEKRRGNFEKQHGAGATELDALEALHPGMLAGMVRKSLSAYYDRTVAQQCTEAERAVNMRWREALRKALEAVPTINETVKIELPKLPEESTPNAEESDTWLFDSTRSNGDQLAAFKEFQGK